MFNKIWSFLLDENNREMLSWVGGSIVAVAGGLWAVVKFYSSKGGDKDKRPPTVSATQGGVAIGGSVTNTDINTGAGKTAEKKKQ
ncbi:MAG TPA: hypothetical protein VNZ48_19525 [Xanthobacteraceae bacterium]|jgi:hypothetical protein|nr:hypothetical protein [Xanthobacteraceae bacterium]